jgi:two-component system cell cycle sensor histidine kinase/response regulator CckA
VMRPSNLNLNDLVGQMTKMLRRILGENFAMDSEYAPNLPTIDADAGMIEQVLMNLVVNARDAMPEGGKLTIVTSVKNVDECEGEASGLADKTCVCLSIADTGEGISPEILPRIFEPFFTTKEVGKGTGLGLATVFGIVKQHHGWIKVVSELGHGTAFHIYFPASNGKSGAKNAETPSTLPGGKETLLVVEDDSSLRSVTVHLIRLYGYTVWSEASGAEALKAWEVHEKEIDLLLTDLVMPDGMSGFDLAAKLQVEKPTLKIIYTSGYSAELAGQKNLLTEGVNFLQKPYDSSKLAKAIRNCLDSK